MHIEIELSSSDPPSGWVTVDNGLVSAFDGWLGLMRVLSEAVSPTPAQEP